MILDVVEEHLLVISDLHLGHPTSRARERLAPFLSYAREIGANVCINGDGLEMIYTNPVRLATESVPFVNQLRTMKEAGLTVYYVVGNHDILLEHFLDDWLATNTSPCLNVSSGGARIRIEHGHLYDPFYMRQPRLYYAATRLNRWLLAADRDMYSVYAKVQARVDRSRRRRAGSNVMEFSAYHGAAELLARRGFDTVVFGHTHMSEDIRLPSGAKYVNSGDWMIGATYVEIHNGETSLKQWTTR